MKKVILSLFIILTSNLFVHSQCNPTNLIIDPGFEIGGPSYTEGCSSTPEVNCVWQLNDGGGITDDLAYAGSYSWKTYGGSAYQESIELLPNTSYIFSCWVNNQYPIEYGLSVRNAAGIFATISWNTQTDNWEKISLPFTTTSENLTVMLEFACHTSTAYFDSFELCEATSSSVNDKTSSNKISIYPNPSKGSTNIHIPDLKPGKRASVKVYNTLGQLVYHDENIEKSIYQFQLNKVSGIYFVQVLADGNTHQFKLLNQ